MLPFCTPSNSSYYPIPVQIPLDTDTEGLCLVFEDSNVQSGLFEYAKLCRSWGHHSFLSAGIPVMFCERGCFPWLLTDS